MKYLGANKQGSNQYRKRIKIDFLGKSTRTFVYYILLVIFFMAFFQLHKTGQVNWPWLEKMVKLQAHAQVRDWKMPELASPQTQDEVKALIHRIWGSDADTGIAIARCESGFRPNALNENTNGTIDQGVFQVNSVHNMPDMTNPTANISYAYIIYTQQGTTPWNSSKHCWGE